MDRHAFESRQIHVDDADDAHGAVIPPIYTSATYEYDGPTITRGTYCYSRMASPTRDDPETLLQPRVERGRHRGGGHGRGRDRRALGRGQHLRLAVPPATARTRCRPRGRVAHEVRLGALRRDPVRGRDPRPGSGRAALDRPVHPWSGSGSAHLLPRHPWREDARPPDGAPLSERAGRRRATPGGRARRPRPLPRAQVAPEPRGRGRPDGRLRRDGELRARRERRGGSRRSSPNSNS
jgi:hypothetical protein